MTRISESVSLPFCFNITNSISVCRTWWSCHLAWFVTKSILFFSGTSNFCTKLFTWSQTWLAIYKWLVNNLEYWGGLVDSTLSKKVPSSSPGWVRRSFCVAFPCSPCDWVRWFLLQHKGMQNKWIGDTKFSVCELCDGVAIQYFHNLPPPVAWDAGIGFSIPLTLQRTSPFGKWMDV